MTVAVSIGTLVGMVAGYYGRWIDSLLMRFVDMMYSFPRLFLLILFGVIFKGMTHRRHRDRAGSACRG